MDEKNYTGELGYDGPLYDKLLSMTDNMLGPSPMHIKYVSYVYDRFCIWRTGIDLNGRLGAFAPGTSDLATRC